MKKSVLLKLRETLEDGFSQVPVVTTFELHSEDNNCELRVFFDKSLRLIPFVHYRAVYDYLCRIFSLPGYTMMPDRVYVGKDSSLRFFFEYSEIFNNIEFDYIEDDLPF